MTLLGLRRENAWPQVCESGYTDGDTHGTSVKELFVLTLLLICENDLAIDQGREGNGLQLYVVMRLFYGCLSGYLRCYQKNVCGQCLV